MDEILQQFAVLFPEINSVFGAGIMIMCRLMGFFRVAPIFSNKSVPQLTRITIAIICTVIIIGILKPEPPNSETPMFICMVLNFLFGFIMGYISDCIMQAIAIGGDIINTQMGLSSASIIDPSTKSQSSAMYTYFSYLSTLILIYSGGIYWLFNAFIHSFEVFPMYNFTFHLEKIYNIEYLMNLTSHMLIIGLHVGSPVLLSTLCQDLILGIISKTAPQLHVFSMSFLSKPVTGSVILVFLIPVLMNVITDYFVSFANIFY